jgi:hypothetical protein
MPKSVKVKEPKPSGVRYNWAALKAEWIDSNLKTGESLNKFKDRHDIRGNGMFYAVVEKEHWLEARDEALTKAIQKAEKKTVSEAADGFRLQGQIYDAGEKQVAYWLQQNVKEGRIVRPLDPGEVASAMLAAYRALTGKRLMQGKATSINEDRTVMVHALLKLQEEIKSTDRGTLYDEAAILDVDPAANE